MSSEVPPGRALVIRWYHALPVVVLAGLLVAWGLARLRPPQPPAGRDDTQKPAGRPSGSRSPVDEAATFPTQPVILYWPRADGAGLEPRPAEVFATASIVDRVKQVVELLQRGPDAQPDPAAESGDLSDPEQGGAPTPAGPEGGPADAQGRSEDGGALVVPLPRGTMLLRAFVDPGGTAYLSLSRELVEGSPGGSAWEQAAVYSIVNSLVRSFPEVQRVQLLIEDREVETIGGHLDARWPLSFSEHALAPPPEASSAAGSGQ